MAAVQAVEELAADVAGKKAAGRLSGDVARRKRAEFALAFLPARLFADIGAGHAKRLVGQPDARQEGPDAHFFDLDLMELYPEPVFQDLQGFIGYHLLCCVDQSVKKGSGTDMPERSAVKFA